MGKKSKKKSSAKASPSKAPTKAPSGSAAKAGGKKRTSTKRAEAPTGGVMAAIQDAFSGGKLPSLPSLPSYSGSGSSSLPTFDPRTGGFVMRRKKSRKGLSASDIKGFLRVNKFAGMLTKVSGVKHRAKVSKRK